MPTITQTKSPTQDEIAELAFGFYEERGRKDGHDVEDWLAAEAHLCADNQHSVHTPSLPGERRKSYDL